MGGGRGRQPDWIGRGIGLVVFAVGIALLATVFVGTYRLGDSLPSPGQRLDQWALGLGVQALRLFASGLVASWIASRGAQMYAAAGAALATD